MPCHRWLPLRDASLSLRVPCEHVWHRPSGAAGRSRRGPACWPARRGARSWTGLVTSPFPRTGAHPHAAARHRDGQECATPRRDGACHVSRHSRSRHRASFESVGHRGSRSISRRDDPRPRSGARGWRTAPPRRCGDLAARRPRPLPAREAVGATSPPKRLVQISTLPIV